MEFFQVQPQNPWRSIALVFLDTETLWWVPGTQIRILQAALSFFESYFKATSQYMMEFFQVQPHNPWRSIAHVFLDTETHTAKSLKPKAWRSIALVCLDTETLW